MKVRAAIVTTICWFRYKYRRHTVVLVALITLFCQQRETLSSRDSERPRTETRVSRWDVTINPGDANAKTNWSKDDNDTSHFPWRKISRVFISTSFTCFTFVFFGVWFLPLNHGHYYSLGRREIKEAPIIIGKSSERQTFFPRAGNLSQWNR